MAKLDPYGHLTWTCGSDDDFWCFDFEVGKRTVRFLAVINSETGSFIQDAEPETEVPLAEAVAEAERLVFAAMDWCVEPPGVRFNRRKAFQFVRDVRKAVRRQAKATQ